MPYRIAHFSDWHLTAIDDRIETVLANIDAVSDAGADHVVITGDIVDCAQLDVLEVFFDQMKARKLLNRKRLTIVPGNHDIFPLAKSPRAMAKKVASRVTPTKTWERFNEMAGLKGADPYPICKKLSDDVVIAGFDTTRNGRYNPADWVRGELPLEQVKKAKRYFQRYAGAKHRIAVMHNYPWRENAHEGPVALDLLNPTPDEAVDLLKDGGATAVLCGHMHDTQVVNLGDGVKGVMTAGADAYSVVTLQRNGSVRVRRY